MSYNMIPPIMGAFGSNLNPDDFKQKLGNKQGSYKIKRSDPFKEMPQSDVKQAHNSTPQSFTLEGGLTTQEFIKLRDQMADVNSKMAKTLGGMEYFKRK